MPNPQNATLFTTRGYPSNVSAVVKSSASGNPLTGGLTNLRALVSIDDGDFALTTGMVGGVAPVERLVGGVGTGWVSLDLTALMTLGTKLDIEIRADNANAVYPTFAIVTADLTPQVARYDLLAGTPRVERLWLDVHDFLWNQEYNDATTQRVFNASNALKGTAMIVESDDSGTRSRLQ